jgi:integrase
MIMAKKKVIPEYSKIIKNGKEYYRTRLRDADGKQVDIYGTTCEEVYDKVQVARKAIDEAIYRRNNPTVSDYCEKWLTMKSATVRPNTLAGYRRTMKKYIIDPIGDRYIDEITADDLRLLMVPVAKMSKGLYGKVNMLVKCVFYSAIESNVIKDNPSACINPRGGKTGKEKSALTDQQISTLIETVKGLPPYVFVMLGLYTGLRREEILGLQWDCVFMDDETPYLSVRRAWRSVNNRPEVSTLLKTPAANRDIPIPKVLVDCLRKAKEKSKSDYVISDSEGNPLSGSQYRRMWQYVEARSTKERTIYRYINGERIHRTIKPKLGQRCRTNKTIYYTLDFKVTPHILRYTYITNLIHEGVDPKTVQYLAGHENSKVTMDIYARVKYNKPWELSKVVNDAFGTASECSET